MLSTFLRGSSLLLPLGIGGIGEGALLRMTELLCEISMIDSIGESLAEEIPLDVEDEEEVEEVEEDEEEEDDDDKEEENGDDEDEDVDEDVDVDEDDESECVFM